MREKTPKTNPPTEGEKYLGMLGLGHLAEQPIPGKPHLRMKDFLDICGDRALPLLVGLESLGADDPRYEPTREALRGYISQFTEPQSTDKG